MNSVAVFCVDYISENTFKKDWESLGSPEPVVVVLREAIATKANKGPYSNTRLLIFVHDSVFSVGTPSMTKKEFIDKLCDEHTWVGIVSSGPLDGQISDSGHQCNLRTAFPNKPQSLSSLSNRFARLKQDIAVAVSVDDSVRAWKAFDQSESFENLTAFSILCQGFLFASALCRLKSDGRTVDRSGLSDDTGDSFSRMGLTHVRSRWVLTDEICKLRLQESVLTAGELDWKRVFGRSEPENDENLVKRLETELVGEVGSQLDDRIKRLLERLKQENHPTTVDPTDVQIVAAAFLAFLDCLNEVA
jgi:hypothetical protein